STKCFAVAEVGNASTRTTRAAGPTDRSIQARTGGASRFHRAGNLNFRGVGVHSPLTGSVSLEAAAMSHTDPDSGIPGLQQSQHRALRERQQRVALDTPPQRERDRDAER